MIPPLFLGEFHPKKISHCPGSMTLFCPLCFPPLLPQLHMDQVASYSSKYLKITKMYRLLKQLKVPVKIFLNKSLNPQEREEINRSAKKQGKPSSAVKSLITDVEKPSSFLSSTSFYKPSTVASKGGKKTAPTSVTTRLAKEKRNVSEIKKKRQQGIEVPLPVSSRRVNCKE